MTEKEKEIVKALECCGMDACGDCPYHDVGDEAEPCSFKLTRDAADLIKSQREEIESSCTEGKWLVTDLGVAGEFECSECGYSYVEGDNTIETGTNFCPECGAKMNG